MKSLLKSVGNFCLVVILIVNFGCYSPSKPVHTTAESVQEKLVPEVSLKSDRENLEELRNRISPEQKEDNDEIALVLGLVNNKNLSRPDIEQRFAQVVHRHRRKFQKKVTELRTHFTREERKQREQYLEEQKVERNRITKKGLSPQKTKSMLLDLDLKRQEFLSQLKDKRTDFEFEVNSQVKDFEFYMKEKQKEFAEQIKLRFSGQLKNQ